MNNENMYGYLLIDTEEKKRKFGPIQKGDLWKSATGWREMVGVDFEVQFHHAITYRRPLVLHDDPDWKLVPLNGDVRNGDEFTMDGERWIMISRPDDTIPLSVTDYLNRFSCDNILAIRRRKKQPAQAVGGWVCPVAESVSNQLKSRAEKGFLKYGTNLTRTDLGFLDYLQHLQEELLDGAVYIERLKLEKTSEQRAFEKFYNETWYGIQKNTLPDGHRELAYTIWKAATAHAKGGK